MITAKHLSCICYLLCALTLCASENYYQRYSYYTSWASSRVQVSFKQSEYTVKESDGRVAIAIQATRGYVYDSFYVKIRASVNRALGYHYASSYDFEESIQTVRFSSRQSTATIYIKIKDDYRVESTEAFQVEILISRDTYSRGVRLGNPTKAKVFIIDDDRVTVTKPPATRPPATRPTSYRVYVSFSQEEYTVKESEGYVVIKAIVSGHRRFPLQVVVISFIPTKFNLPAANSKDFKVGEYKLYFPVSSDVATVKIPIYNDYIVEGTEAFAVNLYIPDYYRNRYVDYGDPFLTKVIINDDDKRLVTEPPPTKSPTTPIVKPVKSIYVQFSQKNYVVDESASYAALRVTVSGSRVSAISVNVKVFVSSGFQPNAATSDDVKTGVTRLIYYPYENTITVRVRIFDDKLIEGAEAFGVQLIIPDHHKANGVKLGNPSLSTVFIRDDDKPATSSPATPVIPPPIPPVPSIPSPTHTTTTTPVILPPTSSPIPPTPPTVPPSTSSFIPPQIPSPTSSPIPPQIPPSTSSSVRPPIPPPISSSIPPEIPSPTSSSIPPEIPSPTSSSIPPEILSPTSSPIPPQIPPSTSSSIPSPIPPPTSSFIPPEIPSPTSSSIPPQIAPSTSSSIPPPIPPPTSSSIPPEIPSPTSSSILPEIPSPTSISIPPPIPPPTSSSIPPPIPSATLSSTPPPISPSTSSSNLIILPSTSLPVFPTSRFLPKIEVYFKEVSYSADESNNITFTVQASEASSFPIFVEFYTQNSNPLSAEDGVDYIAINQTITFLPNETCVSVTVDIMDDHIHEDNETFIGILKISDFALDVISVGEPSTSVGIIIDDDVLVVRFSNKVIRAVESEGSVTFTIISSVPSDSPFTVQVCTRGIVPLSAEADGDYINSVQNITFDDGHNNRNFSVDLVDNKIAESDESFEVFLKLIPNNPYDVIIGEPSVVTVIIYDDEIPSVRLLSNTTSASESDGSVSFTLLTSFPPNDPFTVQVFTMQRNRTTATSGEDFVPVILNVTFEAGETLRNVNVTIIPDVIIEENERFYLQLEGFEGQPNSISEPDGAWATIFDDDVLAVQFSNDVNSVFESDGSISLTIISSATSDSPFTVQVCTREIVPLSAEADGDYVNLVQNITFDDGQNNRNFSVDLVDNNVAESDESFEVFLKLIPNSPYDVIIGEPSVVTVIIYDDEIPSVRLLSNRTSASESDGAVLFTLLTSFPPNDSFTVQVFTMQRNRTTATSGEDFVPVILNVTFEAGETLRNVNVTIIPDEIVEEDERFYVQLEGFEDQPNTISEPDGAWATIFDDDGITEKVEDDGDTTGGGSDGNS